MNVSRREFVGGLTSALALAGCQEMRDCFVKRPKIGLQLYSIHSIFWKSPEVILSALAAHGYDGVEFYDFNGKSGRELKLMCDNAGIKAMGTHLNGDVMLVGNELRRTLDFAAEAGFESLVTPHAKRNTADEYRKFGFTMGLAAEKAAAYGIKVGIHSTYHHFTTKFGNKTAWELIYSEASPLLQQQIDTGNTFNTGTDLVTLFRQYPNRHHSVHLKENVPTKEGVFGERPTDGGECVPWKEVFAYLKTEVGQVWQIVEAEGNPNSLEPAFKCREMIRRMG